MSTNNHSPRSSPQHSTQPIQQQQPPTNQQQQQRRNSTDSHQTSLSAVSTTSTYFDLENAFEKTIATKSLSPFFSNNNLNPLQKDAQKIRNSWISSVSQLSSNIPFTIPHIEVYVEKCENLPSMTSSGSCE